MCLWDGASCCTTPRPLPSALPGRWLGRQGLVGIGGRGSVAGLRLDEIRQGKKALLGRVNAVGQEEAVVTYHKPQAPVLVFNRLKGRSECRALHSDGYRSVVGNGVII